MVTWNGHPLRVGDHVVVDWGFDEVEAEVADVYGEGPTARVLLTVFVRDPEDEVLDDSMTVSFPVDAIRGVLA